MSKKGYSSRSFILNPGYGVTLGNAIRRILMSSVKGFGIVGVKISGVNHTFASIRGVVEDIETIIINLKGMIFKSNLDGFNMSVSAKNGVITAGMFNIIKKRQSHFFDALQSENMDEIENDDQNDDSVIILNPDHHILTVCENSDIEVEIAVQSGTGYVDSSALEVPEGFIGLDVNFSPIKRVSYNVEDVRVGHRTDHNKLTVHVQTNESIDSDEAINNSINILIDELNGLKEQAVDENYKQEEVGSIIDPRWNDKISLLDLSTRAETVMSKLGFLYIGDLITATEKDLALTPGCGSGTMDEVKSALESKYGFTLGMQIENWSEIRPKGVVL